ncbi:hypothetical protein BJ508DRAFT_178508 [Ascobolus immersus RN42]|uniref:Uncharacterized protein n=1 Tax=Ascobolus immersus RN42 TaxID=1160509 RepID=A0A3N4IHF2_ASCIM|nr:hypothetical protein BJ508DRAFT_178508 [Ascobolus immersus RN42]
MDTSFTSSSHGGFASLFFFCFILLLRFGFYRFVCCAFFLIFIGLPRRKGFGFGFGFLHAWAAIRPLHLYLQRWEGCRAERGVGGANWLLLLNY